MDAFKTFAVDAPNSRIADIEDLYVCKKSNKPCTKTCGEDDDWCFLSDLSLKEEQPIEMEFKEGKKWYIVTEIKQIFDILQGLGDDEEYMLVCGGTARGKSKIKIIICYKYRWICEHYIPTSKHSFVLWPLEIRIKELQLFIQIRSRDIFILYEKTKKVSKYFQKS